MQKRQASARVETSDDDDDGMSDLFEDADDDDETSDLFEVESIRLGPNIAGKYLVHWAGYDTDGDTWEPKENLPADMVEKYMEWRFNDDSDSN